MFKIIKRKLIPVAALLLVALQANAASLTLTFDQDTTGNNAFGTLLSLTFANTINDDMTFSGGDFISREWTNLNSLGLGSLDLSDTSISSNVTFSFSPSDIYTLNTYSQSEFSFLETDVSGNTIFFFTRSANQTIVSFFPSLISLTLDSITYDPLGTPESVVSTVPVPAAVWLFGSAILGLFGFSQRKKRVSTHPV